MKQIVDYYAHWFNRNKLPLEDYFLGYDYIPRKKAKDR